MNKDFELDIDALFSEYNVENSKTANTGSVNTPKKSSPAFTNDIEFDIGFRGYKKQQVDEYLDAISADYNRICEKCAELESENESLKKGCDVIAKSILHAENTAQQIIKNAELEAEIIRKSAGNRMKRGVLG